MSNEATRWGAGATWEAALGRALYGADWPADEAELALIEGILSAARIGIAAVELGSPLLTDHNVARVSVQLTAQDDTRN